MYLADDSGLGVGITAKSFHNSDKNVSAVEIDPVVHHYAEQYFGLPKLRGVIAHEDGRAFIEKRANTGEKWDYILHDVFTGGSVPGHLFTEEMWISTKSLLTDNGVLAVVFSRSLVELTQNMVGSLDDESTKAVISTLLSNFNYCRGYKDPLHTTEGPMNMVSNLKILLM